jgi:enterobactin synthetase component D
VAECGGLRNGAARVVPGYGELMETDLAMVRAHMVAMLPDSAVVEVVEVSDRAVELFPDERAQLCEMSTLRRAQFSSGRMAARRALKALGVPACSIPIGCSGAPEWPSGVVGSIAHKRNLCVVAVARCASIVGLGIDVDRDEPLLQATWHGVFRREELARLLMRGAAAEREANLLFSVKEAGFKCLSRLESTISDLLDIAVELDPSDGSVSASHPPSLTRYLAKGKLVVHDGWILTIMSVSH